MFKREAMNKKNKKEIDRRKFLKVLGAGAVTTTAAMYGCSYQSDSAAINRSPGDTQTGEMT